MEIKKWQRKTEWLARYFELAVPMAFVLYVVAMMALIRYRGISFGVVTVAAIGLIYMTMLRDIVQATWNWQALNWLAEIRHHMTQSQVMQLEAQTKKQELKVCRASSLILATVLVALMLMKLSVWSVVARVVIAAVVGALIISHLLMARVQMREELTKIGHPF